MAVAALLLSKKKKKTNIDEYDYDSFELPSYSSTSGKEKLIESSAKFKNAKASASSGSAIKQSASLLNKGNNTAQTGRERTSASTSVKKTIDFAKLNNSQKQQYVDRYNNFYKKNYSVKQFEELLKKNKKN